MKLIKSLLTIVMVTNVSRTAYIKILYSDGRVIKAS